MIKLFNHGLFIWRESWLFRYSVFPNILLDLSHSRPKCGSNGLLKCQYSAIFHIDKNQAFWAFIKVKINNILLAGKMFVKNTVSNFNFLGSGNLFCLQIKPGGIFFDLITQIV